MPWSPVYQGMPVADQYQAPSAGPSSQARIQRTRRFRQAGSQYTSNHYRHASSGTIEEDRSTGINPGYGWISANKEAGVGQVWRTPPKNPLIVDRNLTKQALSTSDEPTRDEVDPSIYEVTTLIASEQSKGTSFSFSILCRPFHHYNSSQERQGIKRFRYLRHQLHRLSRFQ